MVPLFAIFAAARQAGLKRMGLLNSLWQILLIVGSLGIFIYGMKMMSEGVQKLAGQRLRAILRSVTDHPVKGIFTGFVTTSLVQSSSATTVMVVSFVNAGLLTLVESFGIIMGANIGTTLTSWIVNYAGLKVHIAPVAVVLIGLFFPLMFSRRPQWRNLSEFVVGFGILFIGLDFLKSNVPDLNDPANVGILEFLNRFTDLGFLSTLLFIVIGTLLTIVVQSSSASTAITLLMVANGWISFPLGAAMVLGENIGTTITANLAALVANNNAKRAARFHLLFNVIGVTWMLLAMPLVIPFIQGLPFEKPVEVSLDAVQASTYRMEEEPVDAARLALLRDSVRAHGVPEGAIVVIADQHREGGYALASGYPWLAAAREAGVDRLTVTLDAPNDRLPLFHSLFNVANVLLLAWFTPLFSRLVYRMIPSNSEEEEETSLQYIVGGIMDTAELSIEEARKETARFGKLIQKMYGNVVMLYFGTPKSVDNLIDKVRRREEITDEMEIEIAHFLSQVSENDLSSAGSQRIQSILSIVNDLERMGDIFFRLAVSVDRLTEDKVVITESFKTRFRVMVDLVSERIKIMNEGLSGEYGHIDLDDCRRAEERINALRDELNREVFQSLERNKINALQSIAYLNLISSIERVGDHVMNVNESMAGLT
jgi:phosphate:Na+ symporter